MTVEEDFYNNKGEFETIEQSTAPLPRLSESLLVKLKLKKGYKNIKFKEGQFAGALSYFMRLTKNCYYTINEGRIRWYNNDSMIRKIELDRHLLKDILDNSDEAERLKSGWIDIYFHLLEETSEDKLSEEERKTLELEEYINSSKLV